MSEALDAVTDFTSIWCPHIFRLFRFLKSNRSYFKVLTVGRRREAPPSHLRTAAAGQLPSSPRRARGRIEVLGQSLPLLCQLEEQSRIIFNQELTSSDGFEAQEIAKQQEFEWDGV